MSGLRLEDRLHLGIGFRLAPVGRLARDHLQVRIVVDHVVIALRADAGVGVRLLADEFDIIALLAHQLDELLRAELGALIVVRDDLGEGDAGGVDLAVDQEGRNARVLGLLDRRDGGVGAGVVEDDRLGAARDRGVDELRLLVGVVVMDERDDVVAELLRLGLRAFGFRLEERIVVRRRDDRDQIGRVGRTDEESRACEKRASQRAPEFHCYLPFLLRHQDGSSERRSSDALRWMPA